MRLIITATTVNQGGCKGLLKHVSGFKWTRTHEVTKIKKIGDKKDKQYSRFAWRNENKRCSEYLHRQIWLLCAVFTLGQQRDAGQLYWPQKHDVRKAICDRLYEMYKTDEFACCNQSFEAWTSAFCSDQKVCCLPESGYNIRTRKMLDDFYSRALQFCPTEEILEDVKVPLIQFCFFILLNVLFV